MTGWRRYLLITVLAGIAGSALLGVLAVLARDFGRQEWKTLTLTACVTGGGLFSLACLNARDRGRLGPLPVAGVVTAVSGFTLIAYGAWAEVVDNDYWKLAVTLASVGAWTAYVSGQSLSRLAPHYRWSFAASLLFSAALTAVGLLGLWNNARSHDFWRLLGMLSILVAASGLVVLVLGRASRSAASEPRGGRPAFCPGCGHALSRASTCEGCGARFEVRFRAT